MSCAVMMGQLYTQCFFLTWPPLGLKKKKHMYAAPIKHRDCEQVSVKGYWVKRNWRAEQTEQSWEICIHQVYWAPVV